MPPAWLVTLAAARAALMQEAKPFVTTLRHGTMSVELFKPKGRDTQQPHTQDELYFIIQGSGTFSKNGQIVPFQAGDTLFVEAGVEHRFETFSEDFETLVIFWGPEGGEG